MKNEKPSELRILLEISLCVALALALSFVKIFRLPQGGDVSFDVVPLLILALLRGIRAGVACGMIFGLLHSLGGGFIIHPAQFFLDYPMAFGALGLAGAFNKIVFDGQVFKNILFMQLGIFTGMAGRFLFHFASGMLFFKIFAPATVSAAKYVLIYNLSYMVPELLFSFIIIPPVVCKLKGVYES